MPSARGQILEPRGRTANNAHRAAPHPPLLPLRLPHARRARHRRGGAAADGRRRRRGLRCTFAGGPGAARGATECHPPARSLPSLLRPGPAQGRLRPAAAARCAPWQQPPSHPCRTPSSPPPPARRRCSPVAPAQHSRARGRLGGSSSALERQLFSTFPGLVGRTTDAPSPWYGVHCGERPSQPGSPQRMTPPNALIHLQADRKDDILWDPTHDPPPPARYAPRYPYPSKPLLYLPSLCQMAPRDATLRSVAAPTAPPALPGGSVLRLHHGGRPLSRFFLNAGLCAAAGVHPAVLRREGSTVIAPRSTQMNRSIQGAEQPRALAPGVPHSPGSKRRIGWLALRAAQHCLRQSAPLRRAAPRALTAAHPPAPAPAHASSPCTPLLHSGPRLLPPSPYLGCHPPHRPKKLRTCAPACLLFSCGTVYLRL
jgi:hypothetical protein